jgi:hypothetical protein
VVVDNNPLKRRQALTQHEFCSPKKNWARILCGCHHGQQRSRAVQRHVGSKEQRRTKPRHGVVVKKGDFQPVQEINNKLTHDVNSLGRLHKSRPIPGKSEGKPNNAAKAKQAKQRKRQHQRTSSHSTSASPNIKRKNLSFHFKTRRRLICQTPNPNAHGDRGSRKTWQSSRKCLD